MACGVLIFFAWSGGLFRKPDFSKIDDKREMSIVYDGAGEKLKEYCTYCRELAILEEMGHFPRLAVAAEDKDFWERRLPISWRGIARALWRDIRRREIQQGASTITQQVARNLFAEDELRRERESKSYRHKFWRKLLETALAKRMEDGIDKKKILELYLNIVWCGEGRYGVKACSYYYFGKSPIELNIAEAAMIIGTWRSPQFSPFRNPGEALLLRNRVLEQFAREGVITFGDRDEFLKIPLPQKHAIAGCHPEHAIEYARRKIVEERRLVDSGLRVYTTINCAWQMAASESLHKKIEELRSMDPELADIRAVALVISTHSGAIKVFVQEPSFKENQYLIDQIKRPAGSAFKPFFYAEWLLKGGRLSCEDEGSGPCRLDDSYGPKDGPSALVLSLGKGRGVKRIQNFPYEGGLERYAGIIPAIKAIAESRNAATMSGIKGIQESRVPRLVSKEDILELALRLGIKLPLINPETARDRGISLIKPSFAKKMEIPFNTMDPGQTVAIGSMDISPLELVRAFTGLIGGLVSPYIIEEIHNAADAPLFQAEFKEPGNIFLDIFKEILSEKQSGEGATSIDDQAFIESEKTRLGIIRGLRATVEFQHGTAKLAKQRLDFQVLGKTGTATDLNGETTDNWFVGCTPAYCMVVWIGRENRLPMKTIEVENSDGSKQRIHQTGGRNALPVFIDTMRAIYMNQAKEKFPENTDPLKPFKLKIEVVSPQNSATDDADVIQNDY